VATRRTFTIKFAMPSMKTHHVYRQHGAVQGSMMQRGIVQAATAETWSDLRHGAVPVDPRPLHCYGNSEDCGDTEPVSGQPTTACSFTDQQGAPACRMNDV
jgi:hypothetical protein